MNTIQKMSGATTMATSSLDAIVMVSLAPKKLDYCKRHWINLVIIVLPLVAFLRTLQLFNFLRIAKASKLAKVYRLRGAEFGGLLCQQSDRFAERVELVVEVSRRENGHQQEHDVDAADDQRSGAQRTLVLPELATDQCQ